MRSYEDRFNVTPELLRLKRSTLLDAPWKRAIAATVFLGLLAVIVGFPVLHSRGHLGRHRSVYYSPRSFIAMRRCILTCIMSSDSGKTTTHYINCFLYPKKRQNSMNLEHSRCQKLLGIPFQQQNGAGVNVPFGYISICLYLMSWIRKPHMRGTDSLATDLASYMAEKQIPTNDQNPC